MSLRVNNISVASKLHGAETLDGYDSARGGAAGTLAWNLGPRGSTQV